MNTTQDAELIHINDCNNEDIFGLLELFYGSEEQLRIRRFSTIFAEKILTAIHRKPCFFGGSYGEGVRYPSSDIDKLHEVNDIFRIFFHYASETGAPYDAVSPDESVHVQIAGNAEFPGVVTLQLINEESFYSKSISSRQIFIEQDGKYFLSSQKFVRSWLSERGQYIHGPCTSGELGELEYDNAFGFHCEFWAKEALQWISRERVYPNKELIESIISKGIDLVPVGSKLSPDSDREWRISFCKAERLLVFNFNQVQFLIYNLLKNIKSCLFDVMFPNVISSYFIKTVIFWVMEEKLNWSIKNAKSCYILCLEKLKLFLVNMNCPNYFIPENNMFLGKVDAKIQQPLIKLLDLLLKKQFSVIFELNIFYGVKEKPTTYGAREIMESNKDFDSFDEISYCALYIDQAFDTCRSVDEITNILLLLIQIVPDVSSETTKDEHIEWMSNALEKYLLLAYGIANHAITSEKDMKHKQTKVVYDAIENVLIEGQSYDLAAGKLKYATFLFMTGKIVKALMIVKSVIDTYSSHVYYMQTKNMEEYISEFCGKDIPFLEKSSKGFSDSVSFSDKIKLTAPIPIQRIIDNRETVFFDPLVYAYFLCALCHNKQNESIELNDCVSNLVKIVDDDKICCQDHRGRSYLLIGYLKQLQMCHIQAFWFYFRGLRYEDVNRKKFHKSRLRNPGFGFMFRNAFQLLVSSVAIGFKLLFPVNEFNTL